MKEEPRKEHQWLQKLVGEWTLEGDGFAEPGKPSQEVQWSESVRSLGGLWVVAEGRGDMPGCGPSTTLMTIGFDPAKDKYVGTFVGSMMTCLWVYEGALDAARRVLSLEAEGPNMAVPGTTAKYKDVMEFKDDNHRVLTSHMLGDDGQWQVFMTASYRRKK